MCVCRGERSKSREGEFREYMKCVDTFRLASRLCQQLQAAVKFKVRVQSSKLLDGVRLRCPGGERDVQQLGYRPLNVLPTSLMLAADDS